MRDMLTRASGKTLHLASLLSTQSACRQPCANGHCQPLRRGDVMLLHVNKYDPDGPDSYIGLPRSKGVAYVPQESWILSDTIKVPLRISIMSCTSPELERGPAGEYSLRQPLR